MDSLKLLSQAWSAGLSVIAQGDKLVVQGPRSAEHLAKKLLAHKPEVMELLRPTTLPAKVHELLQRLRKGHEWLAETHLRLLEERQVYEGMEDRFLEMLDVWDNLDLGLRTIYGFDICVMGPGGHCPDDSPVWCRACGTPT